MTSWVNLLPINDYYDSYRAMEEAYKEGKRSHCSPQLPSLLKLYPLLFGHVFYRHRSGIGAILLYSYLTPYPAEYFTQTAPQLYPYNTPPAPSKVPCKPHPCQAAHHANSAPQYVRPPLRLFRHRSGRRTNGGKYKSPFLYQQCH